MLTITGSFILHEDYPSQEQMDVDAFFVVDNLKENLNSNLKHNFEIFSNCTNKVTTILASEYQEELKLENIRFRYVSKSIKFTKNVKKTIISV